MRAAIIIFAKMKYICVMFIVLASTGKQFSGCEAGTFNNYEKREHPRTSHENIGSHLKFGSKEKFDDDSNIGFGGYGIGGGDTIVSELPYHLHKGHVDIGKMLGDLTGGLRTDIGISTSGNGDGGLVGVRLGDGGLLSGLLGGGKGGDLLNGLLGGDEGGGLLGGRLGGGKGGGLLNGLLGGGEGGGLLGGLLGGGKGGGLLDGLLGGGKGKGLLGGLLGGGKGGGLLDGLLGGGKGGGLLGGLLGGGEGGGEGGGLLGGLLNGILGGGKGGGLLGGLLGGGEGGGLLGGLLGGGKGGGLLDGLLGGLLGGNGGGGLLGGLLGTVSDLLKSVLGLVLGIVRPLLGGGGSGEGVILGNGRGHEGGLLGSLLGGGGGAGLLSIMSEISGRGHKAHESHSNVDVEAEPWLSFARSNLADFGHGQGVVDASTGFSELGDAQLNVDDQASRSHETDSNFHQLLFKTDQKGNHPFNVQSFIEGLYGGPKLENPAAKTNIILGQAVEENKSGGKI